MSVYRLHRSGIGASALLIMAFGCDTSKHNNPADTALLGGTDTAEQTATTTTTASSTDVTSTTSPTSTSGLPNPPGVTEIPSLDLVDNFEDSNNGIYETEGRRGYWYTYNDGTGSQEPQPGQTANPRNDPMGQQGMRRSFGAKVAEGST